MNTTAELLIVKASLAEQEKNKGINDHDVLELLGNEFPQLNDAFERTAAISNVYNSVQCFAQFTKQLVKQGNLKEVKHCFLVAEKILKTGNACVKNAVQNCYLFSLSTALDLDASVRALLTGPLKKEYLRQVRASGI